MSGFPTISACMIVKNEEEHIPRILSSIKGLAQEIIVVDTGSTDRTIEIAKSFGAKIHYFEWCDDFSAARNESLKHATQDYILWLDADDEIMEEEHQKIRNHLRTHNNAGAFLRLKNVQKEDFSESLQLRIFPNRRGITFEGRVHEQAFYSIQRKGIATFPCEAVIIHHGYSDTANVLEKLKRNRKIQELALQEDPNNINTLFFLAKTLRGLGKTDAAIAHINKMIDLGKQNPQLYGFDVLKLSMIDKAAMFYGMAREEEALSVLEQAKQFFPGYVPLQFALGELYFRRKEYDKAFRELLPLKNETFENEVIPLNINETKRCLRNYLGMSALYAGKFGVAEECFRSSIKDGAIDNASYHYLSLAKEKAGDINGAIAACNEGISKFGREDYLNKRLFLLFTTKSDFENALKVYEKLNGFSMDTDVITGMFLISCKVLNVDEINRYYNILQEKLLMQPQVFPENIEETKKRLKELNEQKPLDFFNGAISFLLNQNT